MAKAAYDDMGGGGPSPLSLFVGGILRGANLFEFSAKNGHFPDQETFLVALLVGTRTDDRSFIHSIS